MENPVIGVVPAGAAIDVVKCTSWCRVRSAQGSGYMARSVIAFGGARGPAVALAPQVVAPAPGYDDAYYDYGYGYDAPYAYNDYDYGYGPDIGLGFYGGPGWRGGHHWRGGDRLGGRRGTDSHFAANPNPGRSFNNAPANAGANRSVAAGRFGGGFNRGGVTTTPAATTPGAGFRGGGMQGGGFHGGGAPGAHH